MRAEDEKHEVWVDFLVLLLLLLLMCLIVVVVVVGPDTRIFVPIDDDDDDATNVGDGADDELGVTTLEEPFDVGELSSAQGSHSRPSTRASSSVCCCS